MVTSAPTHLHNGLLYTIQYGRFEVDFWSRETWKPGECLADALAHHTHFAHSNQFGWWTGDGSQWHRQIEFIRDSDNDHISPFACLRDRVFAHIQFGYSIWLFVSASEFNRYQSECTLDLVHHLARRLATVVEYIFNWFEKQKKNTSAYQMTGEMFNWIYIYRPMAIGRYNPQLHSIKMSTAHACERHRIVSSIDIIVIWWQARLWANIYYANDMNIVASMSCGGGDRDVGRFS